MKVLKVVLASAALALVFAAGQASAQVTFKAPMKFAGTGCKPGSYSFEQNGNSLTIMFSAYDAAKPTSDAASKQWRTGCSFVVPVHVPAGWQVSTLTSDWRGYAKGAVKLFREYFFQGTINGPRRTTSPSGNFTERDNLIHATYTECKPQGRDVLLRINSSVEAVGTPSYIAIDTNDLKNMVVFTMAPRPCPR